MDIISAPRPRLKVESIPMRRRRRRRLTRYRLRRGCCPRPRIVHLTQQPPPSRGCIRASADTPSHLEPAIHIHRGLRLRPRCLYCSRLCVLEFNDEFPFGVDGIGNQACILYKVVLINTRYCTYFCIRRMICLGSTAQAVVDEALIRAGLLPGLCERR